MSCKSIIITGIVALYSAASSPAAVIYTQLPEPRLLGPEIGSFTTVHPFDIDGDGMTDFNFGTNVGGGTSFFPEAGNFIAYSPDPPPNVGGDVGPLPLGSIIGESISMIDASLIWSERSGTVVLCRDVGCGGLFVGRDAYIGLRFERPEGTHFGYIHFVTESDSPYGYLHDWAWETQPGTPIIAGSIPEASTWILILGGFISVIGRRRRNNQGITRRSRATDGAALFSE